MMEPRILVIGRLQSTLDVLVEEWERYGRNVIASNSKERIREIIEKDTVDFVVIGGGLPDDKRDEMVKFIAAIDPSLDVYPIPRTEEAQGAYSFIPFLNNEAIMFKVRRAMNQ
jgi:DNA-binding NtrC family response regulator